MNTLRRGGMYIVLIINPSILGSVKINTFLIMIMIMIGGLMIAFVNICDITFLDELFLENISLGSGDMD